MGLFVYGAGEEDGGEGTQVIANDYLGRSRSFNDWFNYPVEIPDTVNNCANMFIRTSYNQDTIIPSSVTNCVSMFRNSAFNSNITANHDNVSNFCNMFESCYSLNKPVLFDHDTPYTLMANCVAMFGNCFYLNYPISIINHSVYNAYGMFDNCYNFNSDVHITHFASVTYGGIPYLDLSNMFFNCHKLNLNPNLHLSVIPPMYGPRILCSGMFSGCDNFNQPIEIINSVVNCYSMFSQCFNFNARIDFETPSASDITNGLNCCSMLLRCTKFNQNIMLPNSVTNISGMFNYCINMTSHVYLPERFNNGTTGNFWQSCPVSVDNGTLHFY